MCLDNQATPSIMNEKQWEEYKKQWEDSQKKTGPGDTNVCPRCGYCPTCGRPYHSNYPYNPGIGWPYNPIVYCGEAISSQQMRASA